MISGLQVRKAYHSVSQFVDTVPTHPQDWYLAWNVLEIVTRWNRLLVVSKNATLVQRIHLLTNQQLLVANSVAVSLFIPTNLQTTIFFAYTLWISAKCPPGQYSETGLAPCAPCPANFYQPLSGQTVCLECPSSTRTKGTGSAGREECQNVVCTENSCQHGGLCVPMGRLEIEKFAF